MTNLSDALRLPRYRRLEEIDLLDLESVRLVLRGGSVIDWQRLAFESEAEIREFLIAHELDPEDQASQARSEAIKNQAVAYLKRNFDFPIPKPVAQASVAELLMLASGKGHRQLCACTILKVIHVIHHLEARELLSMLTMSDQEVFQLVEQKVYRVIGGMLARGLPIIELVGNRKHKDSLYSKLLSKRETHAAQIYDKLRFRIVTRTADDIFPVLSYLTRHLFPFNYVVPGETTNTMFDLKRYLRGKSVLSPLVEQLQPMADEQGDGGNDNVFSAPSYRVVHFVADMPVRLPPEFLENAPPAASALGQVVFAQAEFQIVDRDSEHTNALGDASHDAYKQRQKLAVARRLKLGNVVTPSARNSVPPVVAKAPSKSPTGKPPVEHLNAKTGKHAGREKRAVSSTPTGKVSEAFKKAARNKVDSKAAYEKGGRVRDRDAPKVSDSLRGHLNPKR